jgi:hypothetical protein
MVDLHLQMRVDFTLNVVVHAPAAHRESQSLPKSRPHIGSSFCSVDGPLYVD